MESNKSSTSKSLSKSEKKKTQAPNLVKETRIEIDNNQYDFLNSYDPSKNLSPPYISKYELTTIIGTRALMLSKNAPTLIEVPDGVDNTTEIAEMEISAGKCPIIVVRELFDGSKEYFKMKDLIIME